MSETGKYVVELIAFVDADSATDAEVLGERAAKEAMKAFTPRSAGTETITKVIVSDVRSEEDSHDESPFLGPDRDRPPSPDYPLAIEEGSRG